MPKTQKEKHHQGEHGLDANNPTEKGGYQGKASKPDRDVLLSDDKCNDAKREQKISETREGMIQKI
ncbi:hypothetical protein GCM10011491_20890 [Brucella endophytica]|uniref:Uncharacterized protein n=1 Tax=Brucella endophytica TaxID=1963359 RepID=A0A916WEA8_9HYPH|nr:hypothetical protein GCM10011491_20890 [Brucella endophytica]